MGIPSTINGLQSPTRNEPLAQNQKKDLSTTGCAPSPLLPPRWCIWYYFSPGYFLGRAFDSSCLHPWTTLSSRTIHSVLQTHALLLNQLWAGYRHTQIRHWADPEGLWECWEDEARTEVRGYMAKREVEAISRVILHRQCKQRESKDCPGAGL